VSDAVRREGVEAFEEEHWLQQAVGGGVDDDDLE